MRAIRLFFPVLVVLLVLLACQARQAQVVPDGGNAAPASQRTEPGPEQPAPSATSEPSPAPRPTETEPPRPTATATAIPAQAAAAVAAPNSPVDDPSPPEAARPAPAAPQRGPALRQLTTGGCCVQPFWAPDGRRVLFVDKPDPASPVGLWGVDTSRPGAAPELYTPRLGSYAGNMAFLVELTSDTTTIERVADGARWTAPSGGRSVSISPGHKYIAWQESDSNRSFARRTSQIWVANLDGSDPHVVTTVLGGGLSGWITDDLLLLSRREEGDETQILYTFSLAGGPSAELARSDRLSGGLLSPDGRWMAYSITLSKEKSQNGLWVVRTDGSVRRQLDRSLYGSYQWRDSRRLLIVPFQLDAASHELWEYDAETGEPRRLTDPAVTPFKIANADWRVSPDGRTVVFLSSADDNLWLLELGEE